MIEKKNVIKPQCKTKAALKVKNKKSASLTIGDLRGKCLEIGDSQFDEYEKTKKLSSAAAALAGYKQAIDAAKTQLIYQKMNGKLKKIDFLEE